MLEDGHHGSTAAAVPALRADRGGVLALDQGAARAGSRRDAAEHVSEIGVGAGERQGEVEQPPLSAPPPVRAVLHLARQVQRGWAVRPRLTLRGVLRSAFGVMCGCVGALFSEYTDTMAASWQPRSSA